jgi:hypothetical protein
VGRQSEEPLVGVVTGTEAQVMVAVVSMVVVVVLGEESGVAVGVKV